MEFLLSLEGWMYNAPAIAVLLVLCWKRPYAGAVAMIGVLVRFVALFWEYGYLLDTSMHTTLAVITMFAWNRGELQWNAALFIVGFGLLFYTQSSVGWLLPETERVRVALASGVSLGAFVAVVRAAISILVFAFTVKKSPTTHEA